MSDLLDRARSFLESGSSASSDEDDALSALVEVDDALRAIYRELGNHPGRAAAAAPLLAELHAERLHLAQRVGEQLLERARGTPPDVASPASALAESPPAATPPPEAESPPASREAVTAFHEKFAGRAPVAETPSSPLILHELLDRAGPPPSKVGGDEIDRLVDIVSAETMTSLLRLDKETQRTFLAMVTARITAARATGDTWTRERLYPLLALIREFSMRERPGAVHGLKRDHEPRYGSWLLDAEHLWQRLGGDVPDLEPSSRSSAPRPRRATAHEVPPVEDRAPPDDWPVWPLVRGTAALMVGGEPREASRARVERTFRLRELVWIPDEPRKIDSAVARVQTQGFELVLILTRFVSHPSSERLLAASSSSGVQCAHVERGYGVEQIRTALDRFLASSPARRAR